MPFFLFSNGFSPNASLTISTALDNSDVYTAVNKIAGDIASAHLNTTNQSIKHLLEYPNPNQTKYSLFQTITVSLLLTGNAYVYISRANNELHYYPTGQVSVKGTGNQLIYSVETDTANMLVDAADMLHFKLLSSGYDESSTYIGRSPLQSLLTDLNIQEYSKELTLKTLKNGVNPSYAIKVNDTVLDKETKDAMRQAFAEQFNTGTTIVLDRSADLQELSISPDVSNFLKNMDFSKTQVAKAFGIPDSTLNGQGDQQSSLEMTRGLYLDAINNLYVKPIEHELSKKLNADIKLDTTSDLEFQNNLINLAKNNIITPELANQKLAERGIV